MVSGYKKTTHRVCVCGFVEGFCCCLYPHENEIMGDNNSIMCFAARRPGGAG